MSFRSYIHNRAYDLGLGQTQRNYCRELLQNESIPLESETSDVILSAVKKHYPGNDSLLVFTRGMFVAYQNETRTRARAADSVQNSLHILNEVYDNADCCKDNGDLREQFRQRPDLHLLALIASGLFEIAAAIRETK